MKFLNDIVANIEVNRKGYALLRKLNLEASRPDFTPILKFEDFVEMLKSIHSVRSLVRSGASMELEMKYRGKLSQQGEALREQFEAGNGLDHKELKQVGELNSFWKCSYLDEEGFAEFEEWSKQMEAHRNQETFATELIDALTKYDVDIETVVKMEFKCLGNLVARAPALNMSTGVSPTPMGIIQRLI